MFPWAVSKSVHTVPLSSTFQFPEKVSPSLGTSQAATGAYWLLHRLRQAAPRRSCWRKATFETLRRTFLKIAVRIEELKSRIKIALPSAYPYQSDLVLIAGKITAQGP